MNNNVFNGNVNSNNNPNNSSSNSSSLVNLITASIISNNTAGAQLSVSSIAVNTSSSLSSSSSSVLQHLHLSSSLPSSISSAVNNPSNQQIDNKMDTSGPLGSNGCSLNGVTSKSLNSTFGSTVFVGDVISRLYPNVNHQENPLPRQWSSIHKCQTLQLTHSNLRVTYKGPGKTHKDAASVRTDYPIPPACGIYYFEVKIISKGRDGYMGIGLSKSEVQLSRLPGNFPNTIKDFKCYFKDQRLKNSIK